MKVSCDPAWVTKNDHFLILLGPVFITWRFLDQRSAIEQMHLGPTILGPAQDLVKSKCLEINIEKWKFSRILHNSRETRFFNWIILWKPKNLNISKVSCDPASVTKSVCDVFAYSCPGPPPPSQRSIVVGFFMVPGGFSWCFMVPGRFSWFFMDPGWFFMVPGRFSWFFMVPGRFSWLQVGFYGSSWF